MPFHIPLICKHHNRESLQFIIALLALAIQCNDIDNIFPKYVAIVLPQNIASHMVDVENGNLRLNKEIENNQYIGGRQAEGKREREKIVYISTDDRLTF